MLTIQDYTVVSSLEEAYKMLQKRRINTLLGGGAFLSLGSKRIGTALDLSGLGLDYINDLVDAIEIGAMTSFRQIETSKLLQENFSGILPHAVSTIGGIQLRNIVTAGATVYSRYGFSDFLTALMVLDADVVLFQKGRISLDKFMKDGSPRDIVIKIILPKSELTAAYKSLRNSTSDLAILNAAVSRKGSTWRIAVGARPQRAALAVAAAEYLANNPLTPESIQHAAQLAAQELVFGTNLRAGREYRQEICQVLVKRAVMEVVK